jgi:hypothetical protein
MKNKKSILVLVALVAVVAILFGVYSAARPKTRAEAPAPDKQEDTVQTGEQTEEQTETQEQTEPQEQTETQEQTEPSADTVAVTVIVVHKDGSEKVFEVETDALYLGEVLLEEGIVEGEVGPYGLMISAADGEVADWNVDQSYWAIFIGEEYATTGADGIPVFGGDVYKLVYTIG